MLKRKLASFAASVALAGSTLIMAASPAFADDQRDFRILNNTTSAVIGLWVAPSASDSWGDDLLDGKGFVPTNGGFVDVSFKYPAPGLCMYWIYAGFDDGGKWELQDVNICEVSTVTMTDNKITAS